ncbi:MAG TPA: cytochrome P450, partial [Mycobacterium sp.]|nr:cytochrome P450 [Mycobacterium sp.]
LTHPEQLAMVYRDRTLIPDAFEEGLRYETPLITVVRTATRDVEIGGKTIPKNAQVDLCMGSANRDESRWTDAGVFDIRRPHKAHMSFGAGEHMCMGMHLARLETQVMLESLFDRVTDLALVPDSDIGIVGLTFRSPNRLPVTFTPAS